MPAFAIVTHCSTGDRCLNEWRFKMHLSTLLLQVGQVVVTEQVQTRMMAPTIAHFGNADGNNNTHVMPIGSRKSR